MKVTYSTHHQRVTQPTHTNFKLTGLLLLLSVMDQDLFCGTLTTTSVPLSGQDNSLSLFQVLIKYSLGVRKIVAAGNIYTALMFDVQDLHIGMALLKSLSLFLVALSEISQCGHCSHSSNSIQFGTPWLESAHITTFFTGL